MGKPSTWETIKLKFHEFELRVAGPIEEPVEFDEEVSCWGHVLVLVS